MMHLCPLKSGTTLPPRSARSLMAATTSIGSCGGPLTCGRPSATDLVKQVKPRAYRDASHGAILQAVFLITAERPALRCA